ncbi:hypothetical protein MHUMG1_05201 [Metarhizium humberi]|uniref:Krev-1 n=1 Tax=Metarhizium humberi TaxID=2596975 RepID=A0A9P8MAH6_9HYPO|nr:hypothetical protein MHUMG1_05201 [Metarhizium humberi]
MNFGFSCSLLAQFVHNEWIESYDPTIEDSYRTHIQVDGRQVVLEILDTAGTEQFAGLREEILRIKDDENVPMVIVGNKADLEENRAVQRAKGFSISQRWGAPYYEASARTRKPTANVDEVFIDLCRQMLRKDDDYLGTTETDDSGFKFDGFRGGHKRRRRMRTREKDHPRCAIL